jgi:hypothetical protein
MKTLIIPDIHERIVENQRILDREDFDKVIFLGDYFDCFNPESGISDLSEWLIGLYEDLGDKAVFLMGNHDLPYYEEIYYGCKFARKRENKKYHCTGYSRNKAKKLMKFFGPNKHPFFHGLKIFEMCGKYCCSHAGFHYSFFSPYKSIEENLDYIEDEWRHFSVCHPDISRFYKIGKARGENGIGGPLWLDFGQEFEPIEGFPQIVGHTNRENVRIKGDNICIDTFSQYYIVHENETIQIKSNIE